MNEAGKIIRVGMDLEVTAHDFPEGTMQQQNHSLYELIGNECSYIEHVMPRRLYSVLGHTNRVDRKNSKCVSMLVDEEFLLHNGLKPNLIGSYLYETELHGNPILGNVLFVGDVYQGGGISFSGIEEETFAMLFEQLKNMALAMKAVVNGGRA